MYKTVASKGARTKWRNTKNGVTNYRKMWGWDFLICMNTSNWTEPYSGSMCVCDGLSVSPNASQGDLAFLLQGFPFNSFWDWNYDEVIFLQKLPMSLVVSLGKFLKCIFNLFLSVLFSLHLSSLPLWLPFSFSELSLDMSMCQCHITRRQYTWNNLAHDRKRKSATSLFRTSTTACLWAIMSWSHTLKKPPT